MALSEKIEKVDTRINKTQERMDKLEKSWAYSILEDYKKTNKRMFIIILILIACLIGSIGYTVYLLNDIGVYETDTIEIEGVETIDNSHIKIGDDIWEKSE